MSRKETGYLPYIDGLRAVAVISVILYHLNAKLLPGGFTGVDIFFAISGYVVSGSVGRLSGISMPKFLAYFYARRLFRIAPALIACLIVTAFALDLFVPFAWLSGTNQKTGLAAFFGLSNFVLANTDNDYFSPRVDFNPFTHTWSLAVEEQFYLVFPWLFIAWLWGKKRLSVALASVAFIASFVWAWHLHGTDANRAFYMLTSRFWELAAGVLLFQAMELSGRGFNAEGEPSRLAIWGATFSALLIAIGLATVAPSSTPFPGGVLPVAGAVGVLGFLHGRKRGGVLLAFLEQGAIRFIGKISYSLYLWHWPVFVLFRWTCGLHSAVPQAAALFLTFGLAIASFYFVETPPRRALKRLAAPRIAAVGIGLAALGAGYGITSALWALGPDISLSTVTRHAAEWYPDGGTPSQNGCKVSSKRVHIQGGDVFIYSRIGCNRPVTYPHNVFVIGDSHAAAYLAMMKRLVLQTGARVYIYGAGGCSFVGLLNPTTPGCAAFEAASVADMRARLRAGDIVFLPSLRLPRFVDQFAIYGENAARAQMFSPATAALRNADTQAAIPVLRKIVAAGGHVVLEAPTPVFPSPAFRCADGFDHTNPICQGGDSVPRATIDALRAPVLRAFANIIAEVPGVSVWDPMRVLCPGTVCSEYDQAKPLFFDGDHLSGYGDEILLPSFLAFIEKR